MNKLLNNLLGMYKQAKLNKQAEEKESAKKDYTEQYAKVKEIMKEYGYGLSDGGYIYLISKEEPKDEGFQVKFKGDRLRVELDGKLKYSGYGPEAIEDFLKGMFYAKKLSSKNTRLTKKAKIVLEQINNEYFLNGKKGDYGDFNYDGKYKQTNYNVFVDDKGKTHKVWEFEGTLDKQTTKKQAEEKLYVAKLYDNKGLKNDNLGKSKSVEELKDLLRDFLFEKRKNRESNPHNNSLYLRDQIVIEDYYTGEPIETIKVSDLLSTYGRDYWKPFMNTEATIKQANKFVIQDIETGLYVNGNDLVETEEQAKVFTNREDAENEIDKRMYGMIDKMKEYPNMWSTNGEDYYQIIELTASTKKQATIKHENGVYNVYSESGKCLGKGYKTKEEAEKRLKQVEYFKHKKSLRDIVISKMAGKTRKIKFKRIDAWNRPIFVDIDSLSKQDGSLNATKGFYLTDVDNLFSEGTTEKEIKDFYKDKKLNKILVYKGQYPNSEPMGNSLEEDTLILI